MKRFNWLLIGLLVLCLAMVSLVGCVSKSEYEALQAEHATLVEENSSLKAELQSVQADLTSVQAELTTVQADLTSVQTDLANLQSNYNKLNASYEAASKELAEIKEVYPPRYFDNYNELDNWVSEHCGLVKGADVFRQHLDFQKMALADGYIWSVEYSEEAIVLSHVVAGDSVYWVWLDGYIEWVAWK